MAHKQAFYDRYGVEEYYLYDPDFNDLSGWLRQGDRLVPIEQLDGWVSPRLGITFVPDERELRLFYPDGQRFLSFIELRAQADRSEVARQEAEAARRQAEAARRQAEAARQQAEQRAEQLAARLRARHRSRGLTQGTLPVTIGAWLVGKRTVHIIPAYPVTRDP
jgi:hypothetical protein